MVALISAICSPVRKVTASSLVKRGGKTVMQIPVAMQTVSVVLSGLVRSGWDITTMIEKSEWSSCLGAFAWRWRSRCSAAIKAHQIIRGTLSVAARSVVGSEKGARAAVSLRRWPARKSLRIASVNAMSVWIGCRCMLKLRG